MSPISTIKETYISLKEPVSLINMPHITYKTAFWHPEGHLLTPDETRHLLTQDATT